MTSHLQRTPKAQLAGLTLIELLVVLSILAVLSTVALRSVVGVFEEKNYDANISQLEEIEDAVLGDDDTAGFLGDIGRLPQAVGDADPTNLEQLAELWDQSSTGLPDYAINTPTGDSEVRLGTGWRGPYLNLGINRDELTDGFANPFLLYQADGADSDNGDTIAIIQSFGADGAFGGTGVYDGDLEVIFQADAGVLPPPNDTEANRWQTDLTVKVDPNTGQIEESDGRFVVVRIYGADGSGGIHTVAQGEFDFDDPPNPTQVVDREFTFNNVAHGPKVFRAYQIKDTAPFTAPTQQEEIIGDGAAPEPTFTVERKSPAKHVVIDRFTGTITLTLYPDATPDPIP